MEILNLNHKKLEVWDLSKKIIKDIYKITEGYPKSELYGIVSQIRRAAISITCNIAEGSSRKSNRERKRFYEISRSSLVEVDSLLEISSDLKLINENDYSKILESVVLLFKKLSKLIEKTQQLTTHN